MTDSTTELQAIREELAEIRAALPPPRKPKRDKRAILTCRLEHDEIAALDAAAALAHQSRSDFVRSTLVGVLGMVIKPRQEMPPQLQRARNRRKPSHFHDPKVPLERDPREQARKAVRLNHEAQAIMRELRGADAPAPQVSPGMLSETAPARFPVPKPSR